MGPFDGACCRALSLPAVRKQLGMDKSKRITGEALRTLEALYDRTPYPSNEVIK